MMERGKKNTARRIFYDALEIVAQKIEQMPQAAPAPVKVEAKPGAKAVSADENTNAVDVQKSAVDAHHVGSRRTGNDSDVQFAADGIAGK